MSAFAIMSLHLLKRNCRLGVLRLRRPLRRRPRSLVLSPAASRSPNSARSIVTLGTAASWYYLRLQVLMYCFEPSHLRHVTLPSCSSGTSKIDISVESLQSRIDYFTVRARKELLVGVPRSNDSDMGMNNFHSLATAIILFSIKGREGTAVAAAGWPSRG